MAEGEPSGAERIEALVRALVGRSEERRERAAAELARLGEPAAAALGTALAERRPSRAAVVAIYRLLADLGEAGAGALPGVARRLAAGSRAWEDGELLRALIAVGPPALELLSRLLEADEPGVRVRAALLVGGFGAAAAGLRQQLAARAAADPDLLVRARAAEALASIDGS